MAVLCSFHLAVCEDLESLVSFQGNPNNYKYDPNNKTLSLTLSQTAGSMWSSRQAYFHGIFSARIKVPSGYSAGVVTTFYLVSQDDDRDEIDIEILGNANSSEVIIHTNFYSKGNGSHEEQFSIWYDPTEYHTYTIIWSYYHVVWLIDGIPIREYLQDTSDVLAERNVYKPMVPEGSLWDGSPWASRAPNGTILQIDWSKSPFTTTYADVSFNKTCLYVEGAPTTDCSAAPYPTQYLWDVPLTWKQYNRLKWVRRHHLVYSYLDTEGVLPVGGGNHPPGVGGHRKSSLTG